MRGALWGIAVAVLGSSCSCGPPVVDFDGGSGGGGGGGGGGGNGGSGAAGGGSGGSSNVGESCDNPELVPITWAGLTGTGSALGTLLGARNDVDTACASSGPDKVYRFTLDRRATLTATVTAQGLTPSLTLGRGCPLPSHFACDSLGRLGGVALEPDTYDLIVDNGAVVPGSFTLSIVLMQSPDGGFAGDDCSAPLPLLLDGGSRHFSGSTTTWRDDYAGAVNAGRNAPDLVFSFVAPVPSRLDVRYAGEVFATSFFPNVMFLQQACGGRDLRFQGGGGPNMPAQVTGLILPAGTYHLWLDGQSMRSGRYSLDAQLAPADAGALPGETCENAIPLVFDGGVATVQGDRSRYLDDDSACSGEGSPDISYSFSIDAGRMLRASVDEGDVTLRSSCADGGVIACRVSSTTMAIPPGDYVLTVQYIGEYAHTLTVQLQ